MQRKFSNFHLLIVLIWALINVHTPAVAEPTARPSLESGFLAPPAEARPWVYWFWSDGNLTREGVTADLEAMARVGIGGVIIMEVDQGIPRGPVRFMSSAWRDMFDFVLAEADRLGITVCMNNDAGWTGSGGPWITPEQSMQMVTWSTTCVKGPSQAELLLAQPETRHDYYRDIAVLAFPTPAADKPTMRDAGVQLKAIHADVESGPVEEPLLDGNTGTKVSLTNRHDRPATLLFSFDEPFEACSITVNLDEQQTAWSHKYDMTLEASDDGETFRPLAEFRAEWFVHCANFKPTAARYYRLRFNTHKPTIVVSGVTLHRSPRIEGISRKAGYTRRNRIPDTPITLPDEAAINVSDVRNLTAACKDNGTLRWDVPPGDWTIVRLGYTTTGKTNDPAPPEGIGLECDKLSRSAVEAHFDGLIGPLVASARQAGRESLTMTHIDSWEVGSQNWTPGLETAFQNHHGYDPTPYLPALTGRYVQDAETSERFLWDLRSVIGERLAREYAGGMQRIAAEHGLALSIEAYGDAVFNDLTYVGRADIPMGEFWTNAMGMDSCKAMASGAHIYGKPIVAAETLTAFARLGKWQNHPATLKAIGDQAFCAGINRFVLHRYAMQPWLNRVPGMTMGPWGIHFERTNTWWNQATPWLTCLTRCQYLLQQGTFVADVAYLMGEQTPNSAPRRRDLQPALPEGYDYDVLTTEVLLNRIIVRDGRLVLPDGVSYRVLAMPADRRMTLPVLERIGHLVSEGATVVGPPPLTSPSLADADEGDEHLRTLVSDIWGECDGKTVTQRRVGDGRVYWGAPLEKALADLKQPPDFAFQTDGYPLELRSIHRRTSRAELYFMANGSKAGGTARCAFRITGRDPQLWWPETGVIERPAIYHQARRQTIIPIYLEPLESVFVVFAKHEPANPNAIVSIAREGEVVVDAHWQGDADSVGPACPADTFTMCQWVKPEVDTPLPQQANHGVSAMLGRPNWAIYPAPGHETFSAGHDTFGRPDHAGVGLAVGRNGVVVAEHAGNYFAPVLVHETPIEDWTHVAVVYRERTPHLMINGEPVATGLTSQYTVHPSITATRKVSVFDYQGQRSDARSFDDALTSTQIKRSMTRTAPNVNRTPIIELTRIDEAIRVNCRQPGRYTLIHADGRTRTFNAQALPASIALTGPWEVHFPPGWGAPAHTTFDRLVPWNQHELEGVRHFSGTAVYRTTIDVPAELVGPNHQLYLDLGRVAVIAEVNINDQPLGLRWRPPFRVEISNAIKSPGPHALSIAVTNLWPNRLIGDARLPSDGDFHGHADDPWPAWLLAGKPSPTGRHTFSTWQHYKADDPLQTSGLLGPVTLRATNVRIVNP